jgi:hypothetical protein
LDRWIAEAMVRTESSADRNMVKHSFLGTQGFQLWTGAFAGTEMRTWGRIAARRDGLLEELGWAQAGRSKARMIRERSLNLQCATCDNNALELVWRRKLPTRKAKVRVGSSKTAFDCRSRDLLRS